VKRPSQSSILYWNLHKYHMLIWWNDHLSHQFYTKTYTNITTNINRKDLQSFHQIYMWYLCMFQYRIDDWDGRFTRFTCDICVCFSIELMHLSHQFYTKTYTNITTNINRKDLHWKIILKNYVVWSSIIGILITVDLFMMSTVYLK
jgi:hypothetical protein